MKNAKLVLTSLLNSLGVLIYVSLISLLLTNGEKIFGKMNNFFAPAAFLMLFIFSALITGLLALGKPIHLYLNDQKKDAVKLLFYTIGWMLVITLVVFIVIILLK